MTVRELQQRHGGQWFAHGELYAVKDASGRSTTSTLKAATMLLQVSWKDGYCSYLLEDKARVLLGLTGEHNRLNSFDDDEHLATVCP